MRKYTPAKDRVAPEVLDAFRLVQRAEDEGNACGGRLKTAKDHRPLAATRRLPAWEAHRFAQPYDGAPRRHQLGMQPTTTLDRIHC
jgi:hypothetical protein